MDSSSPTPSGSSSGMPSETLRELEAMMQDAEEGDVYLEMEQTTEDESDEGDSDYMLAEDEIEEEFEEEEEGDEDEEEQEEEEEEEDEDEGVQGGAITLRQLMSMLARREVVAQVSGPDGQGRGIVLNNLPRSRIAQLFGLASTADDDDAEEQEEDDDDDGWSGWGRSRNSVPMQECWEKCEVPIEAGRELRRGGEFGRPDVRMDVDGEKAHRSAFGKGSNMAERIAQRSAMRYRVPKSTLASCVPNTNGTEVAAYGARVYCGQYSEDSSFFYTCDQSFEVHLYDTTVAPLKEVRILNRRFGGDSHQTSLKHIKTIQGTGRWTTTDAHLSPDNQWMIYSSITPIVHLCPTRSVGSNEQVKLDFSAGGMDGNGIWSLRFSGDSREIVAGGTGGSISVFDIEARRRTLKIMGHHEDVNGVAWADQGSSNILLSASDDTFVKVWDRRSLSGGKPAGVFPGHTEGLTYVSPKGDGRYLISNGKDQSLKLWDLRQMQSSTEFDGDSRNRLDVGLRNWDYRNPSYSKPRFQARPNDASVMTYRGHAVLSTLIRCHFSPTATTNQQYIYSGSADGRIHIWHLDGRVVQVLDRNLARPLSETADSTPTDPSAPERVGAPPARRTAARRNYYGRAESSTVRDVSWHSSEPSLMSTSWEGATDGGSIAKHEWKNWRKLGCSFEDAIEKTRLEAASQMLY